MITITDFIGHCDQQGRPIGHPVKVINETAELISPFSPVGIAASEKHLLQIRNGEAYQCFRLKHSVCAFSNDKIGNFRKKWENLQYTFKVTSDKLWFINVDFSLFLYLFLHKKAAKRSIVTLCYNPLRNAGGWRGKIIRAVLKSVNLIVVTNSNFLSVVPGNTIYLPDYYYSDQLYGQYQGGNPEKQTVCLGTMGETKKLEELVAAYSATSEQLVIAGNFSQNEERFEKLNARKTENITLINRRIANDEFYRLIAQSKYVVMPYDMCLYDERTSGILLEAVFLHRIPVAPKKLLDYNGINGIGYQELKELPVLLGDREAEAEIIEKNDKLIDTVFSVDTIREKLKGKLAL